MTLALALFEMNNIKTSKTSASSNKSNEMSDNDNEDTIVNVDSDTYLIKIKGKSNYSICFVLIIFVFHSYHIYRNSSLLPVLKKPFNKFTMKRV